MYETSTDGDALFFVTVTGNESEGFGECQDISMCIRHPVSGSKTNIEQKFLLRLRGGQFTSNLFD